MRVALAVLVVIASTRHARADARTQQIATGYEKEQRNCKIHRDGLAKVLEGARGLNADSPDSALEADIKQLDDALDIVGAFCDELVKATDLLRADPNAPYKSLQAQIDEHDKLIRGMRKASAKAVDDTQPIFGRLVPRINQRNANNAGPATKTKPEPPPPPKPEPSKPEPPKPAEPPPPSEGPTSSLAVHAFNGGTCDDQARKLASTERATWEREAPKQHPAWSLAWLPGAKWKLSYTTGDRFVQIECVNGRGGGYLVTLEEADRARPDRDLLDLAAHSLQRP
jgi:hypothetical protein